MSQNPDQVVSLTIDGRTARVPRGTLLVEAAKSIGITVPVFCYHEKMKPVGACRMCLVEIEKMPKLQTACTTPVAEGQIVHTNSPKVIAAQRSVIEFLLTNHPLDCPICDKGGECPLQDNAFGWGVGTSRFEDAKRHFLKPIDLSPEIKLDRERCIMCLRCVRFEKEIAGGESLVVVSRGSGSEIGTAPGRVFDSPFSGNTIEICPVGALTSTQFRFRARIWDLQQVPSICDKCAVGCNLKLQVRTNQVLRLWSRENPDVDDSWLCDRGRFDYQYVNSPERLQQPLVRRDGMLKPATWVEALIAVRDGLRGVIERHGAGAVGGIASPRGTNEENYLFQKLFRAVLGSANVDHRTTPHPPRGRLPYDAATGSIAGLESTRAIVIVDADPLREQPIVDLRIKKAAGLGARIFVIGPDRIDLTRYGRWTRVGADAVAELLRAVQHVWMRDGLHATAFADARIEGIEALRHDVARFAPEAVAGSVGLSAADIEALAKELAAAGATTSPAPSLAILFRRDLTGQSDGAARVDLLAAISDLALLAGCIGQPSGGLYPLLTAANEQGCIDLGLAPGRLPGQRSTDDADGSADLESLWGARPPSEPGLSGAEMISGGVRGLYVIGHDPASDPASAAALDALEFLVVQDVFLTSTASRANVVLPGVTFAERDGTYTNLERRVQRLRSGIQPPGEARPDWEIVRDVANALGGSFDYSRPQDVMAEITLAAPMYRSITYDRIGDKGLQWPRGAGGRGSRTLYADDTRFTVGQNVSIPVGGGR
jgi:NADH-quinone oxidoreductase subunit G